MDGRPAVPVSSDSLMAMIIHIFNIYVQLEWGL